IWPDHCSVSPDGRHFALYAGQTPEVWKCYRALSRAPYFSAVALYRIGNAMCPPGLGWTKEGAFLINPTSDTLYADGVRLVNDSHCVDTSR
ncbi:hypothetical protein KIPB_014705, partial [Kipferlia bialata]